MESPWSLYGAGGLYGVSVRLGVSTGSLWGLHGAERSLWGLHVVSMGLRGLYGVSMGVYGVSNGSLWVPMGSL